MSPIKFLSHRKLLWPLGGVLFLIVLLAGTMWERRNGSPVGTASSAPPAFDLGVPTAREVHGLVRSYGRRLEITEQKLTQASLEIARLRDDLQQSHKSQEGPALPDSLLSPLVPEPAKAQPRFRRFDFSDSSGERRDPHIPAGSFGEATLLTGVYAPVSGEPLPVLLRLDFALVGPGRSRLPLPNAFLVGKAQGDANTERAVVQILSLSYVSRSGQTVEIPVNGWVIDADGIQGLHGTYVWRGGEIAGLAALTGAVSGAADTLAAGEITTLSGPLGSSSSVTGDPARFAGSRATSSALNKISEIIARRMEELTPAIAVANGQKVTVAFIQGATLSNFSFEEEDRDPGSDAYRGLDLRR